MTRGSFFIIVDEDGQQKVYVSAEFNGDMYIEEGSYGEDAVQNFTSKTVKDLNDFKQFIKDFNERNFQYDDDLMVWEANEEHDYFSFKGVTDVFDIESHKYHSDYSFWRNLTKDVIEMHAENGVIQIQPGDGAVFNYDEFYDMHNSEYENDWGAEEIRSSSEALVYTDAVRRAELMDEYDFTEEEAQELINNHMDRFHELYCLYGYLEDVANDYLDNHDVDDYLRDFIDTTKLGKSIIKEDGYYMFECSERVMYYLP